MTYPQPQLGSPPDAASWVRVLARYRDPDMRRSVWNLVITAAPLALLWLLAWIALDRGHWWGLVLTVPAAAFLVRLFMIQHDCGHRSFFRRPGANDWVGRVIGVLTLTPYEYWRRNHAIHHATSGDLDRRGLGAVETLTVREYLALPWYKRLRYRLYRHPAVLFGLGPTYMFVLQQRLPVGQMRAGWKPWVSAMGTNAAVAGFVAGGVWLFGPTPFLLAWLPTVVLAGTVGIWLFYVQHQFERTSWARGEDWTLHEAALHGSSHYDLPPLLRWFTANIGVHHVHHLNSRIPFYRLGEVLRDNPQLEAVGRLTLRDSFRCVRLALWDETRQRLVGFREAHAAA